MFVKKIDRFPIDGIVLLDKPKAISSNGALQKVKHLFKARKAGHTGSLDPLASGLLPICLGQATKITQFLLTAEKTYCATACLGITTTTGDKEGEILKVTKVPNFSTELIEKVLKSFVGSQNQVPPMYSALKHKGQPLYKLARLGIKVPRKARVIHIYALKLLNVEKTTQGVFFSLKIRCSKGTYIRTLVEDIAKVLGCGAHITVLRRIALGPFSAEHMVTLDTLNAALHVEPNGLKVHLFPIQSALLGWPLLQLSSQQVCDVQHGRAIQVLGFEQTGKVQLCAPSGFLVGIGESFSNGCVSPKRIFTP